MSTLEYTGPTVYSTKSTGRWQFLMQGMYLTVPTKWDWDITFRISKRAIPEITKVLAEAGVVLNDRDRAQVFKLFDIEYEGYMWGNLSKGDKALLHWKHVIPDSDDDY